MPKNSRHGSEFTPSSLGMDRAGTATPIWARRALCRLIMRPALKPPPPAPEHNAWISPPLHLHVERHQPRQGAQGRSLDSSPVAVTCRGYVLASLACTLHQVHWEYDDAADVER